MEVDPMLNEEIRRRSLAMKDHLIELRRDLHQHPEPSQKEVRTQAQIIGELAAIGITEYKVYYKTGLAAIIRGASPGPTIGMRADMDALYIQEETGLEFSSENPGLMHACGHDCHMTMLLGAARVLYSMKESLGGNIKLIFQPAEEDGLNGGGSQWMIKEGVLTDEPKVDFVIGQHIDVDHGAGDIACRPGPFFTTSDLFEINIIGKGGHSAYPHLTNDPILCAAYCVTALQSIVSRNVDPKDAVVLSVCTIGGGSRHNIIPDTCKMSGGARSFTEENSALCRKRIRSIVENTCAAFGCREEIIFNKSYGPVYNDITMYEKCRKWSSSVVGREHFLLVPPNNGGEDFSNFAKDIPGVFFLVGAKPVGRPACSPHTCGFAVNEDALPYGVMNLTAVAANYLGAGE
jgi:amidohydrolase